MFLQIHLASPEFIKDESADVLVTVSDSRQQVFDILGGGETEVSHGSLAHFLAGVFRHALDQLSLESSGQLLQLTVLTLDALQIAGQFDAHSSEVPVVHQLQGPLQQTLHYLLVQDLVQPRVVTVLLLQNR